jgi:ankyrin repeat protein
VGKWWKNGPANLQQRNFHGNTLLHLAVMSGSYLLLKKLLHLGLAVDVPGSLSAGFPLTFAAEQKSMRLVRLLIDAGANINLVGGLYGSPLGAAAANGSTEVV